MIDDDNVTHQEFSDFEEWFYGVEGYGLRAERFYFDIEHHANHEQMKNWLKWAFVMGCRSRHKK